MSNIDTIEHQILDYVKSKFVQPIIEQSIPDIQTVRRNASTGQIEPYIAIQLGDLQQGRGKSFAGPRGDDYILPIYFQAIAPTIEVARGLRNKLVDVFLGEDFPWTGNVRKRPGGGYFPMTNSNNATEAYAAPSSFGILVQFE